MGRIVMLTLITILSVNIFTFVDVYGYDQVKVLGHRMSVDSAGMVHISGIVENASNNAVRLVHVTASLYDEKGNVLPTYDTYTLLRTIPEGYVAPFDIPISDKRVSSNVSFYTLSLKWKIAQPVADKLVFSDIKAFVWTHIDPNSKQVRNPHGNTIETHDSHAHAEISAIVKNMGDLTKVVKVIAIWYDERGQYYSYSMQTISRQLVPLENGKFVVMTHPTMGYYTLMAESEHYVSMFSENGDRMIRIYEANEDNQFLPGVDTMKIDDIIIKDTENNIIDRIPIKSKPVLPHFKAILGESIHVVDERGRIHQLQVRTYENQLIDFRYDEKTKTMILFTNEADVKSTIHVEIIIPNTFKEIITADSFEATLNGALLHDRLFLVDPYSYEGKTAMHYILTGNDLKFLSEQMDDQFSSRLVYTLQPIVSSKEFTAKIGEQLQLQSTVTNNIDKKQKFIYILQVIDSDGATVMLSWIDGNILSKESMITVLSWTPEEEGRYTMKIFLWESLIYPCTMSSNFATSTFVVS